MKPFKLLNRPGPRAALLKIRGHHQTSIGEGVDNLVALHGVAHIESGRRIVRGDQ